MVYGRAAILAVVLFGIFVIATGLYSKFGYHLALLVYQTQQSFIAEEKKGLRAVVAIEDYLRVDPDSLRMRGLLVDAAISISHYDRAVEAAEQGLDIAKPDGRPLALLMLGRAVLAAGDLDRAESVYLEVLEWWPKSHEAHFGLAQILAASGDFDTMVDEFEQIRSILYEESTEEFIASIEGGLTDNPSSREFVLAQLKIGNFDEVVTLLKNTNSSDASREILFWQGVLQERGGHMDAAILSYGQSNILNSRLAKNALERLRAR